MHFKSFGSIFREHRFLLLISTIGLFYTLGNGGIWFILPLKANALLDNFMLVGLLIAVPNLVSLFFDVPTGGLSDHLGRKKILFTGLFGMALLGLLLPSVDSLPKFLAFMVVFGLMNQFIFISCRAYIMDISHIGKTSEYFGVFGSFGQVGFALGPVIAGVIIADNLSVGEVDTGLFYAVMCFLALFLLFFLRETVKVDSAFVSVKELLQKDKLVLRELVDFKSLHFAGFIVFLVTFVLTFTDGWIWTLEPLYTTLGIDSVTVGLILSMFVLPFIIFEAPAGYLADRHGKQKMLTAGLILSGVFFIIFGLSGKTPILLLSSAFIATTGLAFARPSMEGLLTDLAEEKQKGGIVGVWDVSEDMGYIIGPILGGLIAEFYRDITIPFIFLGCLILLLIPPVIFFLPKNEPKVIRGKEDIQKVLASVGEGR
ncbi:MAG: MFS transporter [Candidatus Altiarchaeota archaeon]|nr:MFS transporter [Candidatus Altiarchaeota archaeon]